MLLTTQTRTERLQAAWSAATVIEPERVLAVKLVLARPDAASSAPVAVKHIAWQLPPGVELVIAPILPLEVAAEPVTLELGFRAGRETFGEITARLDIVGSEPVPLEPVWLSVFARRREAGAELSDEGRMRLVGVVNARPRNGHIFLADFVAFFDDFLNIEVPSSIAGALAEELLLGGEGLPLDAERRQLVIHGGMTFHGIERLELAAAEDCEECDDHFATEAVREVPRDPGVSDVIDPDAGKAGEEP